MSLLRRGRLLYRIGLLLAGSCCAASAQNYPERPIRLIAPFPVGGLVDVLSRAMGDELSKALGQPVIIENKPGAGGNLGADAVAKSAPDGYTLLMTSPGIQSINQFLYKSMPFEPETAFAPVSMLADMPMLVVVQAKTNLRTLEELIRFARTHPNKLRFGSAGIGTTGHLGQALLTHVADIKLAHIPYRGAAPAVTDLIAGKIDGVVDNPPTVMPHIKTGTITPLAVAGKARLSVLPDTPTSSEAGLPGWQASSWFGVVAPAGTPPEIIRRLQAQIAAAVQQPSMQRFTREFGVTMVGNRPEEFADIIRHERRKWGEIIKGANIQAN